MAAALQLANRIRAEAGLELDNIRQPLMMHSRCTRGDTDIHLVVDHVHDHLQHRRYDPAAARAARCEHGSAVLEHHRRRHRAQRPFACFNRIRHPADQSIGICCAGLGGKIIHFVVQDKAGAGDTHAGTERQIECIAVGNHVAVSVNNGEVRRIDTLFFQRDAGRNLLRGPRLLHVDPGSEFPGVLFARQPIARHVVEICISKVFTPICKGEFGNLDKQMNIIGAFRAILPDWKMLENIQHLDNMYAAGARGRHRDDVIATVGAADRVPDNRLIGSERFCVDQTAAFFHFGDDFFRDLATIESVRTVFGNLFERPGKICLYEALPWQIGLAILFEEILERRNVAAKPITRPLQSVRHVVADLDSIPGQFDRRGQQSLPWQLAVLAVGKMQSRYRAGHTCRQMAEPGSLHIDIAVGIEEHVTRHTDRCNLAIIDRFGFSVSSRINEHEPAATDISCAWSDYCQREADGDRGIDGCATICKNTCADLAGRNIRRYDHTLSVPHWMAHIRITDDVGSLSLGGQVRRRQNNSDCHQNNAWISHHRTSQSITAMWP